MIGVIYFDFAKAFDKVQHQRLLFKLKVVPFMQKRLNRFLSHPFGT